MPYIGKTPTQGVRQRYMYTATAGQTTFSGTDTQSLTLSYSDSNFIDVYQNGVLLKTGTDYTATSGTSVVLTTGASVSDVVEMIVYDVFASADYFTRTDSDNRYLNVDGDTMTGSLDLNGTELVLDVDGDTSITADTDDQIDIRVGGSDIAHVTSDGLGIGTSSVNFDIQVHQSDSTNSIIQFTNSTTGTTSNDGLLVGINSSEQAQVFNRENTDLLFATNNTERARIGSSGEIQIGGTTNAGFIDFDGSNLQFNTQRNPNTGTFVNTGRAHTSMTMFDGNGTAANSYIRFLTTDANNTGASERMRILSGGGLTFNGDTAAANALDDYEEGVWTPALTGPSSVAYSSQIGNYTKIGRMVFLSFSMTISSAPTGASNYRIVIPFTPEGSSSREYGGDIFVDTALVTSNYGHFLGIYNGTTNVYIYTSAGSARSSSGDWQTGTLSGHIFINT